MSCRLSDWDRRSRACCVRHRCLKSIRRRVEAGLSADCPGSQPAKVERGGLPTPPGKCSSRAAMLTTRRCPTIAPLRDSGDAAVPEFDHRRSPAPVQVQRLSLAFGAWHIARRSDPAAAGALSGGSPSTLWWTEDISRAMAVAPRSRRRQRAGVEPALWPPRISLLSCIDLARWSCRASSGP